MCSIYTAVAMTIYKTTAGGLVLFHLLNAVLCIPLSEFYPYAADAPESVQKLTDGNTAFSNEIYVVEPIRFYDEAQDTVIVS